MAQRTAGMPQNRRPWLLLVGTIAAGAIAAYLSVTAIQRQGLPVGCGAESGCAEVLSSRWSTVAGVPVSVPAVVVYVGLALAAWYSSRRWAQLYLRFATVLLPVSAAWFLGLQAFAVRAFCRWCVAEHVLGILLACIAALHWRPPTVDDAPPQHRLASGLGVVAVAVLAAMQIVLPPPATTTRLPDDASGSPAAATALTLLNGHLQVGLDEPRWGPRDAPRSLYLMFDYCCPHCRRTHDYLSSAMDRHPGAFDVVCLPMPRDADCNEEIVETEARFEHACELAALALAVWRVDPHQFADYDHWLFAQPQPPTPADARRRAEQMIDVDRLKQALEAPELSQRIARNVAAFNASQAQYLPVMMAPGMDPVVGRPASEAALIEIVESELLKSAAFSGAANATPMEGEPAAP